MKKVFKVHSLLGLISGIFILIFSLTGAVIVFWDELEAASHGDLIYMEKKSGSLKTSLDKVYKLALTKYPEYTAYRITQMDEEGKSIEVGLMKNDFEERFSVYIDPYTGKVLGEAHN